MAKGDFIALLDQDDVLSKNALFEVVSLLHLNENYKLIFSNEDKVDEKECSVHEKVYKIQGRTNPWIKSSCEILRSKSSKSSQE